MPSYRLEEYEVSSGGAETCGVKINMQISIILLSFSIYPHLATLADPKEA